MSSDADGFEVKFDRNGLPFELSALGGTQIMIMSLTESPESFTVAYVVTGFDGEPCFDGYSAEDDLGGIYVGGAQSRDTADDIEWNGTWEFKPALDARATSVTIEVVVDRAVPEDDEDDFLGARSQHP